MTWDWLTHAFGFEKEGELELTDAERAAAERVCREVAARGMTVPALMFLEMSRPLNYVGAQALHFFQPMLSAMTDAEGPKHFATLLEKRGSIDFLCDRLTELQRGTGTATSATSSPEPHARDAKQPLEK